MGTNKLKKFDFRQDELQTVICRTHFTVTANTHKEAIGIVKSFGGKDIHDCSDDRLHIETSELILETAVSLNVKDNGGEATILIYGDNEFKSEQSPVITNKSVIPLPEQESYIR